jgi:hypothetical protein
MTVFLWRLYDVPEAALSFSANVFLAMLLFIEYSEWFVLQLCL